MTRLKTQNNAFNMTKNLEVEHSITEPLHYPILPFLYIHTDMYAPFLVISLNFGTDAFIFCTQVHV